jgi:hypothetical protein
VAQAAKGRRAGPLFDQKIEGMTAELSRRRPVAAGFSLRRALAILLLPASLLPIVLLAPSLARAPETLVVRLERMVASAQRPVYRAPYEPPRYPPGASRFEVDAFAPAAGVLTPQVGVSALAEHQTRAEKAHAPILLITGEPEARSAP